MLIYLLSNYRSFVATMLAASLLATKLSPPFLKSYNQIRNNYERKTLYFGIVARNIQHALTEGPCSRRMGQEFVTERARKQVLRFLAEVSVVKHNHLNLKALPTDTPAAGFRWGVNLYDRHPTTGVSVASAQWFNQLQAITDTYDIKRLNNIFR